MEFLCKKMKKLLLTYMSVFCHSISKDFAFTEKYCKFIVYPQLYISKMFMNSSRRFSWSSLLFTIFLFFFSTFFVCHCFSSLPAFLVPTYAGLKSFCFLCFLFLIVIYSVRKNITLFVSITSEKIELIFMEISNFNINLNHTR